MKEQDPIIRLDLWLKVARIVKSRSSAVKLCDSGKVKVNGRSVKPAKIISVGDVISVFIHGRRRELTIRGIAHRSIAAKLAAELYEEAPPTQQELEQQKMEHLARIAARDHKPKYPGRPTKRDRRTLDKFRNNS